MRIDVPAIWRMALSEEDARGQRGEDEKRIASERPEDGDVDVPCCRMVLGYLHVVFGARGLVSGGYACR